MLERIHLSNFQGYKGSKSIDLAPLTLIFGPNSGGKSSIIRSLLLLKQSLASGDQDISDLTYVGQSVNLVGFPNVVFGHDTKEKVLVGFEINNSWKLEQLHSVGVRYEVDESGINVIWLDFEIGIIGDDRELIPEDYRSGRVIIRLEPQKINEQSDSIPGFEDQRLLWSAVRIDNSAILDSLHLGVGRILGRMRLGKKEEYETSALGVKREYKNRGEDFWKDAFKNLPLRYLLPTDRGPGILNPNKNQKSEPESLDAKYVVAILLNSGNASIALQFEGTTHLDPLREIPARIEVAGGSSSSQNFEEKRGSLNRVSGWIEQLTEGRFSLDLSNSELYFADADFLGNVKTRLLVDNHTGTKVSFQDVGVGLSQVEPILSALENALSKKRSSKLRRSNSSAAPKTLLMQQPELHLHPRMQSDLMNVLVEAVNAPGSNLQVIAETHSENMILRLQRKIREGEIDIDQVCVLFAEKTPDGEGNRILRLELDSEGRFINRWPISFLDIRLDDLL